MIVKNQMNNNESEIRKGQEGEARRINKKLRFILELLIYAALIFTFVYIVPNYVLQRTIVEGPSMQHALEDGDQLMVEKLSTLFDRLKRYDVIVFYPQGDESLHEYYVKRIIGLPGETVQIVDQTIFIDGEPISENYASSPFLDAGLASEPILLGEDEYFVLGDNRSISLDSRYSSVGVVKRSYIGGKVLIRIWPLDSFGAVR